MPARVISSCRDDRLNQRMEHALAAHGLRLTIVRDRDDLLRLLMEPDVRVVVLDARAPGLSVTDVLHQAARAGADAASVVLCPEDDPQTAEAAREAGAREVVRLPAAPQMVVQAVRLAAAHAERTYLLMESRRHRSRLRRLQRELMTDIKSKLLASEAGPVTEEWDLDSVGVQVEGGAVDFTASRPLAGGSVVAAVGTEPGLGGLDTVLSAALCKQAYLRASGRCHDDLPELLEALANGCRRQSGQESCPAWLLLRLDSSGQNCAAVRTGRMVLALYSAERAEWRLPDWRPSEPVAGQAVYRWQDTLKPADTVVACSGGLAGAGRPGTEQLGPEALLDVLWDVEDMSPGGIAQALVAAAVRHAGGSADLRDDATCLVATRRGARQGDRASLKVERRMDELLRVRSFCRDLARPVLSEADSARLVLAADEAMSNIVRHAGRADCPVALNGRRSEEGVEVEFRYEGPAFQPGEPPELPDRSEPYPQGGFGLYIIDQSADEVEYSRTDGVNSIRLAVRT